MALTVASLEGEEAGYPKSHWKDGQFYAVRRLIVGWNDVSALLAQLDTSPNDQYPYPEGTPNALAREAITEPLGAQTNAAGENQAQYEKARVEVRYSTQGPSWFNGHYIHEHLEPVGERYPINHSALRWASNSGPQVVAADGATKMAYNFDYIITFHRSMTVPAGVEEWTECINSNIVYAPTLDMHFGRFTLLYKGATIDQTSTIAGLLTQSVSMRFGYKRLGWNTQWCSLSNSHEALYRSGGNQYIGYTAVPFNLFAA